MPHRHFLKHCTGKAEYLKIFKLSNHNDIFIHKTIIYFIKSHLFILLF